MRMKYLIMAILFLFGIYVSSVAQPQNVGKSSPNQEFIDGSSINFQKARNFSDSFVEAIIKDMYSDLRRKLAKDLRDSIPEEQIKPTLDKIYATYGGKPLEPEFKMDEIGYKLYSEGVKKPLRKFWYAIRTTEHKKGTHFLFVEVVPEGDRLVCAGFSIVTFPLGVPPALK